MSSTRSAARVFDFAVRPHDNAADAVAYFDTLTRLMVRRGLSPTFRRMAAFACGTTDDADGWLALASGDAAELTDQAFWRFAYDAEGKAA
jgi:hypothetical protein